MKCYYCTTELEHNGGGIFKCFTCPHLVTYICSGSSSKIHVRTVDIVLPSYVCSLEQDAKQCNLYDRRPNEVGLSLQRILSLNYLPDITPDNALDWIERLLKLKVFS